MRTSPFMGQPHSTDQCRCLPNSQHLPESLTRRVVVRPFAPLSRGWPASPRNGGRLQFGTVAGIKSESRPASNRNTWPECVGICTLPNSTHRKENDREETTVYCCTAGVLFACLCC